MNRIKFHGRSSAREGKTILLKAALALVLSAQLFNTGFVAEAGGELSINSPANGATVDQQSITLSGVGGPNSYIQQVVDGSVVAETMTDVNGNWELTGVGLVCGVDNQITLENSILPEASSFDQNVFSDWSVTLANGNMVNIGVDRRYIEVYQDLAATQPMATLDLGVDSEAASLVQYGDYIYVATSINNASLETVINKINVSDPSNLYLEDTFPLNTGAPFTVGMTSIVINQDGTTLFVGPDNYQVTAVNTTDGSITANYSPIGNGGSSFMSLDISDSGQYLYVYIYDYSSGNLNFTSVDISGFLGGC
ncbi:hypothetical protein H6792_01230 [Candidatus Nomurabacteria bacterium]|nr:hypothetical protein [Candidatus Nomurabacteria bacterium]